MGAELSRPGAWLHAAVAIVRSPQTCFEIVRQRRPWVGVVLFVTFATVVQGLATAPYAIEAMSGALTDAGVRSTETVPVIVYSALAVSPVLALGGWLLEATAIWLLAMAFGSAGRFGHAFSLTVHLSIINFFGGLATVLVFLASRGLGSSTSIDETGLAIGLNLLLPTDSAALEVLYSRVSPFGIWFAVLLALGSMHVLGLPKWRSWIVAVCHWTTVTLLLVSASSLSEMVSR